jgi:hypothetical protein
MFFRVSSFCRRWFRTRPELIGVVGSAVFETLRAAGVRTRKARTVRWCNRLQDILRGTLRKAEETAPLSLFSGPTFHSYGVSDGRAVLSEVIADLFKDLTQADPRRVIGEAAMKLSE